MKVERLYSEIVGRLERKADPKLAELDKQFHKMPDFKSYGIRAPVFTELYRPYRDIFKQLSLGDRFELARMFFKSGYSEQQTLGIAVLGYGAKEMTPAKFDFLEEMANYLNNWAATDWLTIAVLQPLLKTYSKEALRLLKRWNRSENLWKRRASVVAFTRKTGSSGEFIDEALGMCDNLIWDREDMVRKGVGWALKDCMRGDKKRVLDYVKSLRRKGVSSVITLYAIRDLKGKEREEVLKIKTQKS